MDSDGQTLISGHLDNNVRLWDARTGTAIKELTGIHSGQITSVSMSPGMWKFKNMMFIWLNSFFGGFRWEFVIDKFER